MANDKPIMFDKDVAELFGISVRTLQRRVLRPMPGEVDPNRAEPVEIGGRRLWLRENVMRLVGVGMQRGTGR